MFSLVVVLPTLVVGGYLFLIASNQYESEAHFLVRSSNSTPTPSIGISQALSSVTGISGAQNEAMSVADYLTSHDVVATLRRNDQLVERFHRPDADFLSRLWSADPTPELLLSYYQRQVKVEFNTETGITTLRVHSFRPDDSYQLAEKLLELGEQRVNQLNARSYDDAISLSVKQLRDAEGAMAAIQARMAHFRQSRSDIDPTAVGQAQLTLVSQLSAQLASVRAQLNSMGKTINHSSPQYQALAKREQALSAQVAAQSNKLTGSDNAIANDIGGYEDLKLRQQFLAKGYDAAASSLQRAREQAEKQQLYVVRVVEPNLPVKALYPQRWRILITIFVGLMLAYSIGWLIAAGVREHAA
jgi:capsular polysaccharide transport system permease protein